MNLPYNLKSDDGTAFDYYQAVDKATQNIIEYIDKNYNGLTDAYISSAEFTVQNGKLSRGEYQLDFLITGVLWSSYYAVIKKSPGWTLPILELLWQIRKKTSMLKGAADYLRGVIFRLFLPLKNINSSGMTLLSIQDFDKFVKWLRATGEFREEAKRVHCFKQFLDTLSKDTMLEYIGKVQDISNYFNEYTHKVLSVFTNNATYYSQNVLNTMTIREDVILRTKPVQIYHLNMVGAEIMNKGLLPAFKATERKVVLLPGCMRINNGIKCKANQIGEDLICNECNTFCPVATIARIGRYSGFRTIITLHSGNFSGTIQRWAKEITTGVIASACLLNLIPGGHELRRKGIHAQCIPLNFSGCRKHWDANGAPTDFDLSRLHKILQKATLKTEEPLYITN
jgi:hypothetical protein